MHSLAVKIISLSSLFLLTFFAGIFPLRLRRERDPEDTTSLSQDRRRRQLISLCTCFAGGAFFASSMLELLPMVEKEFETVLKHANIETNFPVSEFGICVGFFLILILEQIIHVMKENSEKKHHTEHSALLDKSRINDTGVQVEKPSETEKDSGESDNDDYPPSNHVHPPSNHVHHHGQQHKHDHEPASDVVEDSDHHHDHSMFVDASMKHQNQRHYLRSYLLLVALSIHALFEGLAVGLFQNVDSMIELLGALIIHKCILAFSIGINLVQHNFPPSMVAKSALLFSAMSPIGLGIGILLLKCTTVSLGHIFSAIFQAIATGTFLYVTFFEIFFHELNSRECPKLLKVLMMILGFSLITVVQYFDQKVSSS